ncbi:MAG: protein kinase [Gemmatimonadetes bacterium]|nr:protein kinase [Gemmatimonadota bacterium]
MPPFDPLPHLTDALGADFTVERELGGGGMSRVFLATDASLGRRVVVKMLPADAAYGVSAERFKREISLSARLQHPHIVPLLSAGVSDGLPYFVMPYIEGLTLRERLRHSGEYPVADAVRLLREVASALAYAHRQGVVHRDIKPENILLTDSHAVITDFGVAKALSNATIDGSSGLTSMGIAIGTPAYMSPEQASGDPSTDHRTDIYAFGLIAYELLTGHPPFAARSAQAMIAAHMTESPEPVTSRRPALPPALAALVMRCLAKDAELRPQTAVELLRALDDLSLNATNRREDRPSVAVLPMVNTAGDAENEHFSDGLTDELIGALSKVRELSVCGRTSVFALKGKGLDIRTIAHTLHVAHVLEGSVRRSGERLKVRLQLVDVDGNVLWAEGYDRTFTDVFDVQEDIAQAVVRALKIHLASSRGPLVRPPTKDLVAYELFLKGRAMRRRFTPPDLRRAIAYFEQAIARDPHYATAKAWLSDAHVLLTVLEGNPTSQQVWESRRLALEAVADDGDVADAHWALGQWHMCFERNWAAVDRELQHALALNPDHVDARHMLGLSLLHQGRLDEAELQLKQTLVTDPLLAEARGTLSRLFLTAGQYELAVSHATEAIELNPGLVVVLAARGHALLQAQRYDEGVAEFRALAALPWSGDRERAQLVYALAVAGQTSEARALFHGIDDLTRETAGAYQVAMAHVGLGDTDQAFAWLRRAHIALDPWISALKIDPAFAPLREDARFGPMMQQLNLAG